MNATPPAPRGDRTRALERARALGLDRFSIFVPAVMSVGLVFWLLSELRELLSSQRARRQDKRARLAAMRITDRVTGSTDGATSATRALRPRPVYLVLALALIGGATYVSIDDRETLEAFHNCCRIEGIIPALESSHAIAYAAKLAPTLPKDKAILVNLSGRGDKDIHTVAQQSGLDF